MRIIIILFLMIFSLQLFSQEKDKDRIQYFFSSEIDTLLSWAVSSNALNEGLPLSEDQGYFLNLNYIGYERDTIFTLSLYKYRKPRELFDSTGLIKNWEYFLVANSNRFMYIGENTIPIVLESDYRFGVLKRNYSKQEGFFSTKAMLNYEFKPVMTLRIDSRPHKNYKVYKAIVQY